MRAKLVSVFMLTLFVTFSSAYAVEQLALEPVLSKSDARSTQDFPWVVSGNEELLLKAGTVFTDGGNYEGMALPYLISNPAPIKYPRWALQQGWQGDFSIAIEINKDGSVGRYKVMRSTGHKSLDEAATAAVKTWRFHPAMKDGQSVVTCIQIPVRFQINQE